MARVSHHDGQGAREEPVVRVDADAAQQDARLFGDDGGDVGDDANVVVTYHPQCNGVLGALRLARPTCLDDAIAEACAQVAGVGTVAPMYLDAARHGDESEDIISVDGVAAAGQGEVDTLQVLVDDEHILFGAPLLLAR